MTARLRAFRNDGLSFEVADEGPGDGPAVLLLHGFPQNHRSWDRIAPMLHDGGYRTLAPDLRGYSPYASPRAASEYRMPVLVGDVLALAHAAQARHFHVVGHDWGGALAWAVASSQPGRVLTVTSLSTPHPGALAQAVRKSRQGAKSSYMLAFSIPWLAERAMNLVKGGLERDLGRETAQKYIGALKQPSDWRGPLNWYRGNSPFARGPGVGRCRVNATYVWGSEDPFLGRHAAEGTGEYVDADYEFVTLAAGHWLPEQEPRACAEAILRRLSTGI